MEEDTWEDELEDELNKFFGGDADASASTAGKGAAGRGKHGRGSAGNGKPGRSKAGKLSQSTRARYIWELENNQHMVANKPTTTPLTEEEWEAKMKAVRDDLPNIVYPKTRARLARRLDAIETSDAATRQVARCVVAEHEATRGAMHSRFDELGRKIDTLLEGCSGK
jgi:hypothetical protein